MIQEFVDKFMEEKVQIENAFKEKAPESYKEIVEKVISLLHDDDAYDSVDPERIHEIDDGDYQGTLLYVIAASGYQPDDYWYVKVGYGSCSGCDTLESITGYSDEKPADDQVKDYMTLALHIVQGLKKMGEDIA